MRFQIKWSLPECDIYSSAPVVCVRAMPPVSVWAYIYAGLLALFSFGEKNSFFFLFLEKKDRKAESGKCVPFMRMGRRKKMWEEREREMREERNGKREGEREGIGVALRWLRAGPEYLPFGVVHFCLRSFLFVEAYGLLGAEFWASIYLFRSFPPLPVCLFLFFTYILMFCVNGWMQRTNFVYCRCLSFSCFSFSFPSVLFLFLLYSGCLHVCMWYFFLF